jgi:hypothetical protein
VRHIIQYKLVAFGIIVSEIPLLLLCIELIFGTKAWDWTYLFSGAKFPTNLCILEEGEIGGREEVFELGCPA